MNSIVRLVIIFGSLVFGSVIFWGCNESNLNINEVLKTKREWVIKSYEVGGKKHIITPSSYEKYSMHFDGDRINGFLGCNNFFGNFEIISNTLVINGAGITKRLCPPEVMQKEQDLIQGFLNQKNTFILNKDATITFSNPIFSLILE